MGARIWVSQPVYWAPKRHGYVTDNEPEQLDSSSSSSTSKQVTFDGKINNDEVTYAKIKWVLETIVIGFSMDSVYDVFHTFQEMFPDSDTATWMKLECAKTTYIANFGILMLLHENMNKSPVYTLLSDESLNNRSDNMLWGW